MPVSTLVSLGQLCAASSRPHPLREAVGLSCRRRRSCCTTDPRWTCCERAGHSRDSALAPGVPIKRVAGQDHDRALERCLWVLCGPDF